MVHYTRGGGARTMKWAIVTEKSENGYGGYSPDFPGVGVVGDTPDEVRLLLGEAMDL